MADEELVVFAHVVGTSDRRHAAALLTRPDSVVVPRATPALLDRGADIEVVIVPTPLRPGATIERIRVRTLQELVRPGNPTPTLAIRLERPSVHPPRPLGEQAPTWAAIDAALVANGQDLWAALADLAGLDDTDVAGPDAALLRALPATERAQRELRWSPGDTDWIDWRCLGWRRC